MADEENRQVDIEVALRDTASQTLRGIAREIDGITRKLLETGRRGGDAFQRIKDKSSEAGNSSGKAGEGVDKFTKSITGLAKALSGPLGLAAAFVAVSKSLSNFAQHRVELSLLTEDLGLTIKKIGEIQQILQRKGVAEESSKQFIASIAGQLQDLRTRDVYSDLWRRLTIYGDDKLGADLLRQVKDGNIEKALDTIEQHITGLLKMGDQGALRARYFAREVLGQNLSMFTDWEKFRKELIKTTTVSQEEAERLHKESVDLETKMNNLSKSVADTFITSINRIDEALRRAFKPVPPGTPGFTPGPLGPSPTGPGTPTPGTGTGPSPELGTGTEPGARITVPRSPGKRSSLDSDILPSGARPVSGQIPDAFKTAFRDVAPIEKETNLTLISIRDILIDMTRGPIGLSGTSQGGGLNRLTGGGPTGGGPTGGDGRSVSSIGALGGTVKGYPVDPYGGLTGAKLFDPITATSLGGGVGGHSAAFGPGAHQGVDLMTGGKTGASVHAIMDGKVIRAPQPGRGNNQTMIIDHGNGYFSVYLHQGYDKNKTAGLGSKVEGGKVVSSSGYKNAAHTHFELWRGRPWARGSVLLNPRALFGWTPTNLPVGGRPVTGRGPNDAPVTNAPATPPTPPTTQPPAPGPQSDSGAAKRGITLRSGVRLADTPAADPTGWRTGKVSTFNDRTTSTGLPSSVPGIALPDPSTKGQWFWVRDNRTGKEILTQQTDVGPSAWTGRSIDVNAPLARKFGYKPGRRGAGFPTNAPWSWRPATPPDRPAIDRANRPTGPTSSRSGNVKASVDFSKMRVKEAGEIFLPIKTASFSQGSTVHRNVALPGSPDYTKWTA